MKRINWKIAASLLFGLAILLFWSKLYPYALSYQEQYQLFLYDTDYFLERMSLPGGMADYLAEFFTQFWVSFTLGGLTIAVLSVLLQRFTWQVCKAYGAEKSLYPVSFLPAILVWIMMGDESVMLSYLVALTLLMITAWGTLSPKMPLWSTATVLIVVTPILFWCIGSVAVCYPCMVLLCRKKCQLNWMISLLLMGYALACVFASSLLVNFPVGRIWNGINYYRFAEYNATFQWITTLLTAFIPWISSIQKPIKKPMIECVSLSIFCAAILYAGISLCYDSEKYDLIEYDGLVRGHQWTKVIEKAQQKQPSQPMSVAAVNLALAMCDQLSDHIFEFYQNGVEGLFPAFQRDFTTPVMTSEVYFQLGLVNTAQRYVFEAQEAIPNYRKSARLTRRLAETNIINGKYAVARKYLRRLQKTSMYSSWATEMMMLIQNEEAVNQHPVYGKLRKLRLQQDFLFSDQEHDQMLGLLFTHNHENKMAFEYLLCHTLLQGDLEKFYTYYPLGKYIGYDHIPRAYQEALVYIWTQTHSSYQGLPWSISETTQREMVAFAQMYQANKNNPALREGRFKSSFWNYYLLNE